MKRRHLLPAAAAALAAALIAAAAILVSDPFTPRCRLPDGSTLYLDAVTWGTKTQRLIDGPPWQRTIGALLPDALLNRLGWRFRVLISSRGALAFWLRGAGAQHPERFRADIYDELGHSAIAVPY